MGLGTKPPAQGVKMIVQVKMGQPLSQKAVIHQRVMANKPGGLVDDLMNNHGGMINGHGAHGKASGT